MYSCFPVGLYNPAVLQLTSTATCPDPGSCCRNNITLCCTSGLALRPAGLPLSGWADPPENCAVQDVPDGTVGAAGNNKNGSTKSLLVSNLPMTTVV